MICLLAERTGFGSPYLGNSLEFEAPFLPLVLFSKEPVESCDHTIDAATYAGSQRPVGRSYRKRHRQATEKAEKTKGQAQNKFSPLPPKTMISDRKGRAFAVLCAPRRCQFTSLLLCFFAFVFFPPFVALLLCSQAPDVESRKTATFVLLHLSWHSFVRCDGVKARWKALWVAGE